MGVKSTVTLTRKQAEYQYVEARLAEKRRYFERQAEDMSAEALEIFLERHNDEKCGGHGFDNYLIQG